MLLSKLDLPHVVNMYAKFLVVSFPINITVSLMNNNYIIASLHSNLLYNLLHSNQESEMA